MVGVNDEQDPFVRLLMLHEQDQDRRHGDLVIPSLTEVLRATRGVRASSPLLTEDEAVRLAEEDASGSSGYCD